MYIVTRYPASPSVNFVRICGMYTFLQSAFNGPMDPDCFDHLTLDLTPTFESLSISTSELQALVI